MDLLTFGKKKGVFVNGALTVPMSDLQSLFRNNEKLKKEYYLKKKKKDPMADFIKDRIIW